MISTKFGLGSPEPEDKTKYTGDNKLKNNIYVWRIGEELLQDFFYHWISDRPDSSPARLKQEPVPGVFRNQAITIFNLFFLIQSQPA